MKAPTIAEASALPLNTKVTVIRDSICLRSRLENLLCMHWSNDAHIVHICRVLAVLVLHPVFSSTLTVFGHNVRQVPNIDRIS